MKSKHLLLLTLLLSQTAPVWGMDTDPIEDLHLSMQQSRRKTCDNPEYQRDATRVVIIGDAGRGKTALEHYLAGKDLIASQVSGARYKVDVTDQNRLPESEGIAHTVTAGTTLPSSWYDPTTNSVYWDCPGFKDSRGAKQEIINAFAIHQLFKSPTRAKVVVVANENDLDGRAIEFLELLKRVSEVLPDPSSSQGLSIIITKQRDSEPQELLIKLFNAISADNTHEFRTGPVRNFLEALSSQGRSAAFPNPTQAGIYPATFRTPILASINAAQALDNPRVNLAVSADARLLVRTYGDKLNDKIAELINRDGSQAVIDYCNDKINRNTNSIADLRTNLGNVGTYLTGIKNGLLQLSTLQEDQLQAHLNTLFPQNGANYFPTAALKGMIETLSFLKNIEDNLSYSTNAWAHKFTTIIEKIQQLVKDPEVEVNQNLLTLKGSIIGTSDVVRALQNHQQTPISKVNVFGLNTLFVDQDITSPSTSLNLIAPQWKVLGNKTIQLSGLTGVQGAHGIQPGEDGQPGNPGKNGGSLYGNGVDFYEINHLTVKTDGGCGGAGGNGVRGRDGANGRDGNPALRTRSNGNTHYYHDQGTDGQPGQNGGRKGGGGTGGHKGYSIIDGHNAWNSPAVDGANGTPGNPGAGGTGGVHGKHCQGTHETGRTHQVAYTAYRTENRTRQEPRQGTRKETRTQTVTYERPISENVPGYMFWHPATWVTPFIHETVSKDVSYEVDVPYTYYENVSCQEQVPYTAYRTEALPDVWHIQQGYQAPRGSAPNGTPGDAPGKGLNTNGQQNPAAQNPLNRNDVLPLYKTYYQQTTTNPIMVNFVKVFPNL